jgi:SHS2 domain-containing protein
LSIWPHGTTADIGLRAFAASPDDLVKQVVLGMQQSMLSEVGSKQQSSLPWHHSQWNLPATLDWDRDIVKILEEVLFRAEVHDEWVVDISIFPKGVDSENESHIACQVAWVDASQVEREVEIKAVTRHDLQFIELAIDEELGSNYQEVPVAIGPGWVADLVFDI